MPTQEGIFPKVGNDPLYASEVNRFATGNINLKTGSTDLIGSGRDAIFTGVNGNTLGSVLISAGSVSNPTAIYGTVSHVAGGTNNSLAVFISGATGNGFIFLGNGITSSEKHVQFTIITGSPYEGTFNGFVTKIGINNGDITSENMKYSAKSLDHFDTTQDFVIAFKGQYTNTGSQQVFFDIQGMRSSV